MEMKEELYDPRSSCCIYDSLIGNSVDPLQLLQVSSEVTAAVLHGLCLFTLLLQFQTILMWSLTICYLVQSLNEVTREWVGKVQVSPVSEANDTISKLSKCFVQIYNWPRQNLEKTSYACRESKTL